MNEELVAPPQDTAEPGPGAMLARARAERKVGVAEVAERLKYAQRQIEALEADDFSSLPGLTIIRGMIRGYAKLLDVDPGPILKALDRRNIPSQATVDLRTQRIPFPDGTRHATWVYSALSIVVLVAVAAVLYEWQFVEPAPAPVQAQAPVAAGLPQPAAPVPAPQEPAPVDQAAPAQPSASAPPETPRGQKRVRIEFQGESWVEIKDRDGTTLMSQLNSAGSQKTVEGAPPLSVVIGNASSVRVTYNDASFDLRPHTKVDVARFTLE